MDPPNEFRPGAGRLFADLEVLHYGIAVEAGLTRRDSVLELREHGGRRHGRSSRV